MSYPVSGFNGVSLLTAATFLSLFIVLTAGAFTIAHKRREGLAWLRSQSALLLWVAWVGSTGLFYALDLWLMAFPLLAIYAFAGIRESVVLRWGNENVRRITFLFAGILLIQGQFTFYTSTRFAMENTIDHTQQLASIAYWLNTHAGSAVEVSGEEQGLLRFLTHIPILPLKKNDVPSTGFFVSTKGEIPGYERIYYPMSSLTKIANEHQPDYALWRKK
jgi:hypothetical protein